MSLARKLPRKLYNKRTLRERFMEVTPYTIAYITLFSYEKKGYLVPSGYMPDGKRQVPVYDEQSLTNFIAKLEKLEEAGKVYLKYRR